MSKQFMGHFTLSQIHGYQSEVNVLEIASALNFGDRWSEILSSIQSDGVSILFGQFDPKMLGDGDVASNLRYKHDKEINNKVVQNMYELLDWNSKNSSNPVVLTSYPRSQRYKTMKFNEDHTVQIINNATKDEISEESLQMNNFIQNYLTNDEILKMKEATRGARYNTYLADMISFLLMVNHRYHPEMFDMIVRKPTIFNTEMTDERGEQYLKPIMLNGKEWVPKDFDYLYFQECNKKDGTEFLVPKRDSIGKVYHQLKELISLEENGVKGMIREFLLETNLYQRFSDYGVNDVDDYLTIYMIYNCYKCVSLDELSHEDKHIVSQIESIIESF